jgi:predicted transcriptional regulator of viral defense system
LGHRSSRYIYLLDRCYYSRLKRDEKNLSLLVKGVSNRLSRSIFWPSEISQFIAEHRREWGVATVSIDALLQILIEQKLLIKAEFACNRYKPIVRYLSGKHSINELALSLQRDTFLSHETALAVHGLATPKNTIYVNHEQSPKGRPDEITQVGIRHAFKRKQRQSKYIFDYAAVRYTLLNGKHTDRAGVTQVKAPSGETVDVTDKERTLIDIVVRPAYAGGIERIANIYKKVAKQIDINHMIDLLRQLDHAYPYHQAIGFLMERAGRSETDCQKFEAPGKRFDFYLDYQMKYSTFNSKWRLHYPKSLD